jgi:hypothetical protein
LDEPTLCETAANPNGALQAAQSQYLEEQRNYSSASIGRSDAPRDDDDNTHKLYPIADAVLTDATSTTFHTMATVEIPTGKYDVRGGVVEMPQVPAESAVPKGVGTHASMEKDELLAHNDRDPNKINSVVFDATDFRPVVGIILPHRQFVQMNPSLFWHDPDQSTTKERSCSGFSPGVG